MAALSYPFESMAAFIFHPKALIGLLACLFLIFVIYGIVNFMPRTRYSDMKSEQAEVTQLAYTPESSYVQVTSNPTIDMNGNSTIEINTQTVTVPEKWVVVLRCDEHKKVFALDCKDLYAKVKVADQVTLRYVDEIQWYPRHPENQMVVDQHTKEIVINDAVIQR